jgi:hypothetical protein
MAAPTIRQVITAIETRLLTIPGLRVLGYQADQINPPIAIVMCPPVASYQVGYGDRRPILRPVVQVLVSATVDRVGQLALADYANPDGPGSVPAAATGDLVINGVTVGQCQVLSFDPLNAEEVGAIGYWGGKFTLQITT